MTDEVQAGRPAPADEAQEAGDQPRLDLRETYRRQMLDSIGGWSGTVITAIPPIVFVVINAVTGLRAAIIAAIATAVALAVYRLVRRQSTQQALTGLFGVVIAALIAARTGQARGYFLLGIWSSFAYGGVFAASILVRRPLVGLFWEFLDPSPEPEQPERPEQSHHHPEGARPWYRRRRLLRAYSWATLGGTAVFLARGFVQLTLFRHNATGWLAFARVSMGFPLWLLAVGFGFWVVRRARAQEAAVAD